MRSIIVPAVVGLATAPLAVAPPVAAATFQVESGVTSVFLDFESVLNPLGITLAGADEIADPAPGPFQVGFSIIPETDFTFSDDNTLTPLSGTIEHSGSVTLGVDTLDSDLTVGDFTIGFDAARASETNSGFFVQDNISLNTVLFDITAPPSTVELNAESLILGSDLAVSEEFAAVLATVDKPNLTGAVVGSAQINADLSDDTATVPEPGTVFALFLTGGTLLAQRLRRSA